MEAAVVNAVGATASFLECNERLQTVAPQDLAGEVRSPNLRHGTITDKSYIRNQ